MDIAQINYLINLPMKAPDLPDISFFDQRIQQFVSFVNSCHTKQIRKYTGLPYVYHLISVAKLVAEYTKDDRLFAVALGHDLYEDTECTKEELLTALKQAGFDPRAALFIHERILELTDEYIKSNYPRWNRRRRKTAEAKRLWKVSPEAQTVKYADMIDNVVDIVQHDQGFGRRYLSEMEQILRGMDKGNADLYTRALKTAKACKKKLMKHGK